MSNELNISCRNKKIISLATLASFCIAIPLVNSQTSVNARLNTSPKFRSLFPHASRNLKVSNGKNTDLGKQMRRLSISSQTGVNNTNGGRDTGSIASRRSSSASLLNVNSINERLTELELARKIENEKANHMFNRVVMASGLLASAAMVAGVVGGIVQQANFTKFAKEQSEMDQKVQEDINSMRNHFQKNEVPEAEQIIIKYYKDNYGIDITNQS